MPRLPSTLARYCTLKKPSEVRRAGFGSRATILSQIMNDLGGAARSNSSAPVRRLALGVDIRSIGLG